MSKQYLKSITASLLITSALSTPCNASMTVDFEATTPHGSKRTRGDASEPSFSEPGLSSKKQRVSILSAEHLSSEEEELSKEGLLDLFLDLDSAFDEAASPEALKLKDAFLRADDDVTPDVQKLMMNRLPIERLINKNFAVDESNYHLIDLMIRNRLGVFQEGSGSPLFSRFLEAQKDHYRLCGGEHENSAYISYIFALLYFTGDIDLTSDTQQHLQNSLDKKVEGIQYLLGCLFEKAGRTPTAKLYFQRAAQNGHMGAERKVRPNFDILPDETLLLILLNLDNCHDIINLGRTSHRIHAIVQDESLQGLIRQRKLDTAVAAQIDRDNQSPSNDRNEDELILRWGVFRANEALLAFLESNNHLKKEITARKIIMQSRGMFSKTPFHNFCRFQDFQDVQFFNFCAGKIPKTSLTALKNLRKFTMNRCKLPPKFWSYLQRPESRVHTVTLESCPNTTDSDLQYFNKIEHLTLNECAFITGSGFKDLTALKTLTLINKYSHIEEAALDALRARGVLIRFIMTDHYIFKLIRNIQVKISGGNLAGALHDYRKINIDRLPHRALERFSKIYATLLRHTTSEDL